MGKYGEPWDIETDAVGEDWPPGEGTIGITRIGPLYGAAAINPGCDPDGYISCNQEHAQRVVDCVNALADIGDPAEFVARANQQNELIVRCLDFLLQSRADGGKYPEVECQERDEIIEQLKAGKLDKPYFLTAQAKRDRELLEEAEFIICDWVTLRESFTGRASIVKYEKSGIMIDRSNDFLAKLEGGES
jgi:hypothetical protein